MRCKYCEQEIKKPTNFDKLKACQKEEDVDDLCAFLCEKKICPFIKVCPVELNNGSCLMNIQTEWLFKSAKKMGRKT